MAVICNMINALNTFLMLKYKLIFDGKMGAKNLSANSAVKVGVHLYNYNNNSCNIRSDLELTI